MSHSTASPIGAAGGATATDDPADTVLDTLRGTRDVLNVRRVFGDPFTMDGLTVIPAARIKGGAGGGGGEGSRADEDSGKGFGTGFGLEIVPVGVYELRADHLEWRPTVDVNRLIKGGQVLAGIIAVCVTLVLRRR